MSQTINEDAARRAKEMNSFSTYKPGSATAEYQSYVAEAKEIADDQKSRVDSRYHEKIDRLLAIYCTKMVAHLNRHYDIECKYPSVLIAGPSNFSARKKEQQNAMREKHMQEYAYIQGLLKKIRATGMGGISADDDDAIERIRAKMNDCIASQELMKAANAYFRKHKTCKGCPGLKDEIAARLDKKIAEATYGARVPFASYSLSNNNAEIHRLRARIEAEEKKAATEYQGWEFDGGSVVMNKESNRLQILFDDKPDEAVRAKLKSNGFRYAPSVPAWQRQLTNNAIYAAKHLDCIKPTQNAQ